MLHFARESINRAGGKVFREHCGMLAAKPKTDFNMMVDLSIYFLCLSFLRHGQVCNCTIKVLGPWFLMSTMGRDSSIFQYKMADEMA